VQYAFSEMRRYDTDRSSPAHFLSTMLWSHWGTQLQSSSMAGKPIP
jgi:hypothetical protein